MRMILFDRWDNQLGTLGDISSASWTEELNGEDTVTIETTQPMAKGQRIVWRDGQGQWHEHIISHIEQVHEDDGPVSHLATCENSISELYGDFILDKRPTDAPASRGLSEAIDGSRWTIGRVEVQGVASTNFYRESCRSCIQKVQEAWGGDLSTTIEVGNTSVASRKVNLTHRGTDSGRTFRWGTDMTGIRRIFEADDVVSALYGYGKGEEVGDGHGRGIDFADINGGKQYVEDLEALAVWGRPDGHGGKAHVFGYVEFPDCEDKSELKRLTEEELAKRCTPKVSYRASVQMFSRYGYDFANVGIGDDITLIDTAFSPEVRVKGRVTRIVRDLLDDGSPTEVTIGNIVENAADLIASQEATLRNLASRATNWDVAAYTPLPYLQQIQNAMNLQFDLAGSYVYTSFEQGTISSTVPLDEKLKPTKTPAAAIQIKGGGFRIADSVLPNGEFDWRTFGTGGGFVADCMVLGVLRGGSNFWNLETGDLVFEQGQIRSADGGSTWNLSTGELTTYRMKAIAMDARGSFRCGGDTTYTKLDNTGYMRGYRDNAEIGHIDFLGDVYDRDTSSHRYGPEIYGKGMIRLCAPKLLVCASSNEWDDSYTAYTGTIPAGASIRVVNGIVTGYS